MKKIDIYLNYEDFEEMVLPYTLTNFDNEIILEIHTDEKSMISDLLSNEEIIRNSLEEDLVNLELIDDEKFYKSMDATRSYLNGELNFDLNDCYLSIYGNINDIIQFIKNNNLDHDKVIKIGEFSFDGTITLKDDNFINMAVKELGEYPNLYVKGVENSDVVKLSDYKKTLDYIDKIVYRVKQYDFSPLEQIMYVYDIVRDRVYVKEDENEAYKESRDLTNVILGDKIVCVGYAHIFDSIVDKLGFTAVLYNLKRKQENIGHSRNLIYVKDDKYNINGAYFFDTTWDSKKDEEDLSYLDHYTHFAKTYHQMNIIQSVEYENDMFENFNYKFIDSLVENLNCNVDSNAQYRLANRISYFFDKSSVIDLMKATIPRMAFSEQELKEIKEKLYKYYDMINSNIDISTLIKVLFNVRKVEYYENPEKFKFSIERLHSICTNSKWLVEEAEHRFLLVLFGDTSSTSEDFYKLVKKNNLEEKVKQVQFTKVMQLVLQSKKQENKN